MKYRTPQVRLRQRFAVLFTLAMLLIASTSIAVNALNVAHNRENAEMKRLAELTEISAVPSEKKQGLWVTGDSVILGIRSELEKYQHIGLINARIGRQLPELLSVIEKDRVFAGNVPIIFDIGNNNAITESSFKQVMELVKNQPQIIVVNTAVPRPWRESNNAIVRKVTSNYANVSVINWAEISLNHPDFFASDGVHLNPPGVNAYVSAILEVLKK